MPMKALSIRQPWAWLILNAGKDIENRNWKTNLRGRILIHAAKGMTMNEYVAVANYVKLAGVEAKLPAFEDMQRGGIVGSVEIVDCVSESDSPWFMGKYGFVLRDPRSTPFHPMKGRLMFFDAGDHLLTGA